MTIARPAPSLSVVIPTRNRHRSLQRTVRALGAEAAGHGLPVEIVVVDDASHLPVAVRTENGAGSCSVRVIRLARRSGPAAARNTGADACRSTVIAFIDDDIVPTGTYLRETMAFHWRCPEILVVSGNLEPLRDDLYSRFWFHHYDAAYNRSGEQYPILMLASGHCSLKRQVLEMERPLFDPGLRTGEDLDLSIRLTRRGVVLYKCDRIRALNDCRRSFMAFLRQRADYAEGQRRLAAKHGAGALAELRRKARARPNWRLAHLSLVIRILHAALLVRRGVVRGWQ